MAAAIRFGVLGPLEIRAGDTVVPVSAGQLRTLLALLLLRANRTVPMGDLIDQLWYGTGPANARSTVQKYVMRLRNLMRSIGLRDGGIVTEPEGYVFKLPPDMLDLYQFQALVDEGSRAGKRGDRVGESALLTEALALWRAVPPLSNVTSESLHQRETIELMELRLQTLVRRIDVDLELGRHAELVGELAGLVRDYPLRERFWAQWMRALAGAGRQGEALTAYREVTRLLAEELGIDPGPELRRVHQDLLRGELPVGPPVPAAPEDDHSRPAPTAQAPDAAAGPATVAQLRPVIRQLPVSSSIFVGRTGELRRITDTVRDRVEPVGLPVLVVSGPPGVGKTALTVHAANLLAADFPDGQFFADLHGYSPGGPVSISEVLGRFLGALGVSPPPLRQEDQISLYRSLLADRRMLVVLDNVTSEAEVRALLPGSAGCAVMATSRDQLPGLTVSPGAEQIRLDVLSTGEGHQLLSKVLGDERVAAERSAADELVAVCGGLALALRVAAAHLRLRSGLPIADYLAELKKQERISALSVEGDDHSSLAAAFDGSYRRLGPPERRMLRLLGLVPGRDFSVPTAAALAAVPQAEAAAAVDRLIINNLLEQDTPDRYRLHDLTRAYAMRRCSAEESEPERQQARRRLFDHYITTTDAVVQEFITLSRLERSRPPELTIDRERGLAGLDNDRAAMVAAVRDAAAHGPYQAAYHLADALRGYFTLRGHTSDWLDAVNAGLTAARRAGAQDAVATMLNSRGTLGYYAGDTDNAQEDLEGALAIFQQLDSPVSNAVRINLGNIAEVNGDAPAAIGYFTDALAGFQAVGDEGMVRRARENLILVLSEFGDLTEALHQAKLLQEVAQIAEGHVAMGIMAILTLQTGDLRQAARMLTDAANAAAANSDDRTRLGVQAMLAICQLELGRYDDALQTAGTVLAKPDNEGRNVPMAHVVSAGALRHLGRAEPARAHYRQALDAAFRSRNQAHQCEALIGWSELELVAGLAPEAMQLASRGVTTARNATLQLQLSKALTARAACHRYDKDLDQAARTAEEALEIAARCAYPLGEALAQYELGAIRSSGGERSAAIAHWRQAMRIYTDIGSRRAGHLGRLLAVGGAPSPAVRSAGT